MDVSLKWWHLDDRIILCANCYMVIIDCYMFEEVGYVQCVGLLSISLRCFHLGIIVILELSTLFSQNAPSCQL